MGEKPACHFGGVYQTYFVNATIAFISRLFLCRYTLLRQSGADPSSIPKIVRDAKVAFLSPAGWKRGEADPSSPQFVRDAKVAIPILGTSQKRIVP